MKIFFKKTNGSILVEFAITVPIYIVALLCFTQLFLLIHARFLLHYGAFCAARAGIVSNANEQSMREASSIALSSLFYPSRSKNAVINGMNKALLEFNKNNLKIELLNPNLRSRLNQVQSINDLTQNEKLLKLRLKYNCPLKIPVANRLFYEFYKGLYKFNNNITTLSPDFFGFTFPSYPRIPLSGEYTLRITSIKRSAKL